MEIPMPTIQEGCDGSYRCDHELQRSRIHRPLPGGWRERWNACGRVWNGGSTTPTRLRLSSPEWWRPEGPL